jgi:muramoyltetrapeptide carboxypeptidase
VDPASLDRGIGWLRGLGLEVACGAQVTVSGGAPEPYLAGTDADRAADFAAAWSDPRVGAVLCARGGYGAGRLLDQLDLAALARREDPPWLVGSSDVTVLHTAVRVHLGVATVFGPMIAGEAIGGEQPDVRSRAHLAGVLFGTGPAPLPAGRVLVGGDARGRLVGGTLTLLAAAVGTPWAGSAAGAIVLLEDVDEAPYRLDRMLTQLLQSGWFAGLRGVALGSWERCGPRAEATVLARVGRLGVPVVAGLPVGHGHPQLSVVLGAEATLRGGVLAGSSLG